MIRITVVAASLLALACSTDSPSRVDRNWGSAYRDNIEGMIANPEGGDLDRDPGRDTDGMAEEMAMRRLREPHSGKGSIAPTINMVTLGGTP